MQPGHMLEGMATGMVLADSVSRMAIGIGEDQATSVVTMGISAPLAIGVMEAMNLETLGGSGHEGSGVSSVVSEAVSIDQTVSIYEAVSIVSISVSVSISTPLTKVITKVIGTASVTGGLDPVSID